MHIFKNNKKYKKFLKNTKIINMFVIKVLHIITYKNCCSKVISCFK